jgi:hypothetical protein
MYLYNDKVMVEAYLSCCLHCRSSCCRAWLCARVEGACPRSRPPTPPCPLDAAPAYGCTGRVPSRIPLRPGTARIATGPHGRGGRRLAVPAVLAVPMVRGPCWRNPDAINQSRKGPAAWGRGPSSLSPDVLPQCYRCERHGIRWVLGRPLRGVCAL